ncbi:MAG: protein kinase [Acidobacteriota bacterium]
MHERWQQIDNLVAAALELETADRKAFIDQACADDEALRSEVESLVAVNEQAEHNNFLSKPAIKIPTQMFSADQAESLNSIGGQLFFLAKQIHSQTKKEQFMKRCPACGREYDNSATFCMDDAGRLISIEHSKSQMLDPLIGVLLDGKYKLESLIGGGGMGKIYRTHHISIDKRVAVKVISPSLLEEPDLFERFKREAIAAARINHPNIVPVYDFGQTKEGLAYIVMEYVNGVSLAQLVKQEEKLTTERIVDLIEQVCIAMSAAHNKGIIHRDLKPDNVMVDWLDGKERARVLDFGIAKLSNTKERLTKEGAVIGTVHYMSPEQAKDSGEIDHRSDIYSLGVILYRLFSDQLPFDASGWRQIIVKHMLETPKPLTELCPGFPAVLSAVVMRALEKEPQNRQQTAMELAEQLKAALKISKSDVFISYSIENRDRVRRIVEQLEANEVRVWMDHNRNLDSSSGEVNANNHSAEVEQTIKNAKLLMLMCSNASMRSRIVKEELQIAWKYGVACLPLIIEKMSVLNQLKYWLEGWQAVEVNDYQPMEWLPKVLQSLKRAGIECKDTEMVESTKPRVVTRGIRGIQDNVITSLTKKMAKLIRMDQGLSELRLIAGFTDQIWPVAADRVQRNIKRVRGMGAPQDGVEYRYHLGERICLVMEVEREGHLLLLAEEPDGEIYCLCPSHYAPNLYLQPGRIYLPQEGSPYDSFSLTSRSGREHLTAIITDKPLDLDWMSIDPKVPAQILSEEDLKLLLAKLRNLPVGSWTAMSTYFEVIG